MCMCWCPHVAPTGAPGGLVYAATATSVHVTWSTIDCIGRNGLITHYVPRLSEVGGMSIQGEVVGRSFSASDLTPYTNYTFKVAGVNSNGTGPYSTPIAIQTSQEGKCSICLECTTL